MICDVDRATAVEDTLAWVNNPSMFPYKGSVGELIREMVCRYGKQYGSNLVVSAWDKYRDVATFSKRFDLSKEEDGLEGLLLVSQQAAAAARSCEA